MTSEVWHIVIVDDSPDDRAEARRLLLKGSDRRYAFTEAETGAAGIRALDEGAMAPHRCIVLDYNLPDMAAPAFLAAISGSDGAPGWPVVVFTGGDSAATGRSALRAGAHDYVGKHGLTPQVLVRAVENAAERWAMARELRKQTAAARASEQHFEALARATSDIAYRMSADWSLMYPLDGRALIASTDTPLAGWAWLNQNIPADEHARVRQAINVAIAQKALFALEHRVLRPDGSIGWTASRAVPILDAHGTVLEWFGAASDVTERKQEQERLRLAIAGSDLGTWHWDIGTGGLDWSERCLEIFGLPPRTAMTYEKFLGALHPEDRARADDAVRGALREGSEYRIEFRSVWPDGSVHWAVSVGRAYRDAAGEPTRMEGIALDITERKRTEAALRDTERNYEALAEASSEVPYRMSADWSKMLALDGRGLFASSPNPLAEWAWVEQYLPGDEQARVRQAISDAIAGKNLFELEHRFLRADGSTGWVHSRAVPILDENENLVTWFGAASDISERKQAEQALVDRDMQKDQFLATLAHELRSPLAPLRTGLQVLKLTQDPGVAQRTQVMMERQLGQMVRLVDDLLDLSRITSGKIILRTARIELQAAVRTAIEGVQPLLDAASQTLQLDMPAEPIWLQADAARIRQVVNNVLTNATKYSPHGSSIALGVHRADGEAVVTVADQGAGIPQHMLARIFDMFTQADRTLDEAQGGLGIGLALVKRLVEMHGGAVSASSAGLGAGTTFTVRLPTLDAAHGPECPVEASAVAASATGTRLRVLVVDDNADTAESLAELLSLEGHDTRVADSGLGALAAVPEFKPALVFIDIGMPGMNGYETARRLRADDPSGSLTLVALTGWGAEADRIKAKEAGFDHHFTKPVELGNVESVLQLVALRQSSARSR